MKKLIAIVSVLFASASFANAAAPKNNSDESNKSIPSTTTTTVKVKRVVTDSTVYYSENGNDDEDSYQAPKEEPKKVSSVYSQSKRYNLNDPFYQPIKGGFAGTLDAGYDYGDLKFSILPGTGAWSNYSGDYESTAVSATPTLSYGITDDLSILGSFRLSSSTRYFHWDQALVINDDKETDNQFDSWGLGAQWKFIDNSKWVANVQGSYQVVKDTANTITGNVKAGYKKDGIIYYGFAQVQFVDWKGADGYGLGLKNKYDQTIFFSLNDTASTSTYYDIGAKVFAPIDNEWSVDTGFVYSNAEWYQKLSAELALSYQPLDNLAVSLYGRTSLWNNAEDKNDSNVWLLQNDGTLVYEGMAAFGDYSEYSAGLRLTVSF